MLDGNMIYLLQIWIDPSLGNFGNTNTSLNGYKTMTLGQSAFEDEWICASVLGHENVHGGQNLAQIIIGSELAENPAYEWELNHSGAVPYFYPITSIYSCRPDYYEDCKAKYKYYAGLNIYP